MQIQVIAVGGTRPARAEVFERTLKLAERAEVRTELNIRVKEIALEQKTIVVRGLLIEERLLIAFVFEPCLATERDMNIRAIQGNKLHRVEPVRALGRIVKERPVFVVTQRLESRPLRAERLNANDCE